VTDVSPSAMANAGVANASSDPADNRTETERIPFDPLSSLGSG